MWNVLAGQKQKIGPQPHCSMVETRDNLIMRNKMDQAILKNNNGLVQNAKIQARERLLLTGHR